MQDYINIRILKKSAELYEVLLNYEKKYDSDRGEVLGKPETRSNQVFLFLRVFINEGNSNDI